MRRGGDTVRHAGFRHARQTGGEQRKPAGREHQQGIRIRPRAFQGRITVDHDKSRDPYYTLYGVERIGLASGFKYFETTNWYQAGADFLVSKQNQYGGFSGGGYDNTISTCYALLFLFAGEHRSR